MQQLLPRIFLIKVSLIAREGRVSAERATSPVTGQLADKRPRGLQLAPCRGDLVPEPHSRTRGRREERRQRREDKGEEGEKTKGGEERRLNKGEYKKNTRLIVQSWQEMGGRQAAALFTARTPPSKRPRVLSFRQQTEALKLCPAP
ncbi:hypothetical protein NDU88_004490 [Pleurodeles waltl]|uniref:Uncharacterized protein n=1 Tax=Pleurodeles waltl TaxID=8319 RepID=A0AAV7QEK6_PLEWA|nr:hypothetical protein NDU88_004490 [Pleurodeles waltl]